MGADTRWRCPGQDCAALPGFTCACAHALYPDRMRSYHGHEPACDPSLRCCVHQSQGTKASIHALSPWLRNPAGILIKASKCQKIKTRELPIGKPPELFSLAKMWQQSCGGS